MTVLKASWERCVNDRQSNFWTRQRLNWETRYCVWGGQTMDGRKWARGQTARVWPWQGAADSRVPLIEKYVREDVALLMQTWSDMRILVRPTVPARDAGWANRMTSMLRWLVYEEMEEAEGEAEYLANLILERGAAAMGVWWKREETAARETIAMEQIGAAAEQARQRLAAGEQGDALQFQAMLPSLIMDPSQEKTAVEFLSGVFGAAGETPAGARGTRAFPADRVRKMLRDLRETGTAHYPRTIVAVNRPCVRALGWNEDIWTPPETVDLQQSREVHVREFLADASLEQRCKALDWDPNYVDEVLEKHKGQVTELTDGPGRRTAGLWNSLGTPDTSYLYEVVTSYERLVDADGVPGIYVTSFNPAMPTDRGCAGSALLDYAHGEYPFIGFQSERRSRLVDDARGYGETGSTFQTQIKKQWDARIDRTDVATLPPSHHPPGEEPDAWGPGVQIPTMQPERFGYFEIPRWDPGSKEVEETVRKFADEFYGRPVDEQNLVQAALLAKELTRKWMRGWKGVHTHVLKLAQQYMPDEIFFRVVGGEQGRGIRATREEIQGPFNVTLKFNPQDLDRELVQEKLELMRQALDIDVNGIVDRNEAIAAAMELIDPAYAERLLRPAGSAALAEVKDEQDTLAKLLLGIKVDVQGNEAFALRKQVLTEMLQTNPVAQQLMASQPAIAENVARHVQQLDFNIQQKLVNPEIGRRLGTEPAVNPGGA